MKKLICALMLAILLLTLCGCGIAIGSTYPNANKYAVGSFTYDAVRVSAGSDLMVTFLVAVWEGPSPAVPVRVRVVDLTSVEDPETTPVFLFRENPEGMVPEVTFQVTAMSLAFSMASEDTVVP